MRFHILEGSESSDNLLPVATIISGHQTHLECSTSIYCLFLCLLLSFHSSYLFLFRKRCIISIGQIGADVPRLLPLLVLLLVTDTFFFRNFRAQHIGLTDLSALKSFKRLKLYRLLVEKATAHHVLQLHRILELARYLTPALEGFLGLQGVLDIECEFRDVAP